MANVIKKTPDTHGIYQYVESVSTPDYIEAEWEYNPNISLVESISRNYWKYDGTNNVQEMTQDEKDTVDSSLRESSAIVNEVGEFQFGNRGRTTNRWLRTATYMQPSIKMPYVFLNDGVITGLNYLSYTDSSDTDIRVYKNGSLYYTWEVRNKRYAYKTNDLSHLSYNKGDQVAIYMRKVGSSTPLFPLVTVQYRYNTQLTGEGGEATL